MFTGLIQGLGAVVRWNGPVLTVQTPWKKFQLGESIAVDGVCLTVEKSQGSRATFTVGPETRRVTTLGAWKPGRPVNLERALRVGDALGGHWVTGHVEGTARLQSARRDGESWWVRLALPPGLSKFVIPKGSLAVDGVSLTVAHCRGAQVDIMIVPHTMAHTTLPHKRPGDRLNIETDLLGKYALRSRRAP